jgi:hypothetical protein
MHPASAVTRLVEGRRSGKRTARELSLHPLLVDRLSSVPLTGGLPATATACAFSDTEPLLLVGDESARLHVCRWRSGTSTALDSGHTGARQSLGLQLSEEGRLNCWQLPKL